MQLIDGHCSHWMFLVTKNGARAHVLPHCHVAIYQNHTCSEMRFRFCGVGLCETVFLMGANCSCYLAHNTTLKITCMFNRMEENDPLGLKEWISRAVVVLLTAALGQCTVNTTTHYWARL